MVVFSLGYVTNPFPSKVLCLKRNGVLSSLPQYHLAIIVPVAILEIAFVFFILLLTCSGSPGGGLHLPCECVQFVNVLIALVSLGLFVSFWYAGVVDNVGVDQRDLLAKFPPAGTFLIKGHAVSFSFGGVGSGVRSCVCEDSVSFKFGVILKSYF